jgi:hypothetical protein
MYLKDETTGNSSEGESTLSRSKGKGKGKAKKKKYPNLTEINESKNNCRSRLEAKIFNRFVKFNHTKYLK